MIVQGQDSDVLFFLTSATSAPAGLPGQTFSGSEIVIIKPNAATAPVTNIATVVDKGGGWYLLTLTAAETGIGLAAGRAGMLGIEVSKSGAVPNRAIGFDVVATAPGTLTDAERAAIVAAVAAALPTAGAVATAVDAAVADNFTAVTSAIAAIPPAPSTSAITSAVLAAAVDGPRTVAQALAIAGSTGNKATLPMSNAGGSAVVRNAADSDDLMIGSIAANGARTWTKAPGLP